MEENGACWTECLFQCSLYLFPLCLTYIPHVWQAATFHAYISSATENAKRLGKKHEGGQKDAGDTHSHLVHLHCTYQAATLNILLKYPNMFTLPACASNQIKLQN